jgi:hypothetical protein
MGDTPPVQARLTPDGMAQRTGFGTARLEPWGPFHVCELMRRPDNLWRLRVFVPMAGCSWLFTACPIDIEFQSDENTIARIRDATRQWISRGPM